MNIHSTWTRGLALTGLLFGPSLKIDAQNAKAERPNIIFILSDDAGYADFGFQGSKQMLTPHLDSLARQGVIFNQLYTTDAVSGPSRAGLMTGRYQQRFGIEENNVPGLMSSHGLTGDEMGVPLDQKFLSNYLQEAGYKTAIFGKWHLGSADKYHPYQRGYDHFVGFRTGARSYYAYRQEKQISGSQHEKRFEYGFRNYHEPQEYVTTLLAKETNQFIEQHQNDPFFIYLAFSAPHSPMDIDPKAMERFANLKGKRRKLAAMTWSLDEACGMVFQKLRELGLDDNTLIVFSSDNGGPDGTETSNYPLSGCKATFLEGGIRVPGVMSYPSQITPNSRYPHPVSFMDFLPTFVDLAGGRVDQKAIDGVNILPYLQGKIEGRPHQTLYWKAENRGVVRDGDWKFMRYPDRPAELYRIDRDASEHRNLAAQYPQLVKKYYQMLFDWEMTLERPLWMLDRFCEERVLDNFYENPKYRYAKEEK